MSHGAEPTVTLPDWKVSSRRGFFKPSLLSAEEKWEVLASLDCFSSWQHCSERKSNLRRRFLLNLPALGLCLSHCGLANNLQWQSFILSTHVLPTIPARRLLQRLKSKKAKRHFLQWAGTDKVSRWDGPGETAVRWLHRLRLIQTCSLLPELGRNILFCQS